MKRLALLFALAACTKAAPPVPSDASADAAVTKPDAVATLSIASEKLHAVAIMTHKLMFIDSLTLHGDVMWLAYSEGNAAFAFKDGPLEKALPPLRGLSTKPTQKIVPVGVPPQLIVLLAEEDKPPLVFVSHPAERVNRWQEVRDLGFATTPVAFLPYRDGAMAVTTSATGRGTVLTLIGLNDKAVRRVDLVDESFVAWAGAADETGVSLLGATLEKGTKVGMHIHQIGNDEETRRTTIHTKAWDMLPSIPVYRNKGITTVQTFSVDRTAAKRERTVPGDCPVRRSRFFGDVLYAIRDCKPNRDLVRVPASGSAERVELPPVNGQPCQPVEIVAGYGDDLWIRASCEPGDTEVVFRRGGADQKPAEL